ncbi:MAG: hypothetical protein AB7H97_19035 [Pseudobdellovibrionaceae bacterium]
MQCWQSATKADHRLWFVIKIIFRNHPELLDFLFEKDEPRIRLEPLELRKQALCFSSGEELLVRVALDVWSGSGNAKIWQLIETLDCDNLSNVLEALSFLNCRERDN